MFLLLKLEIAGTLRLMWKSISSRAKLGYRYLPRCMFQYFRFTQRGMQCNFNTQPLHGSLLCYCKMYPRCCSPCCCISHPPSVYCEPRLKLILAIRFLLLSIRSWPLSISPSSSPNHVRILQIHFGKPGSEDSLSTLLLFLPAQSAQYLSRQE